MYLHIGQDWMIALPDIIGIFQQKLMERSPDFMAMFRRWRHQGRVFGDWDEAKAVILTDHRIFLTSISSHTLIKRAAHRGLWFDSF